MISVTSNLIGYRLFLVFSAVCFFSAAHSLVAQEQWIDFVVEKDSNMMSVSIDLRYYIQKPSYKNLVIIGTGFKPCMGNGFPSPESLDSLYSFSDSTAAVINQKTKNELIGILTYKCLAFDVYYAKDTLGIREGIEKMVHENFIGNTPYLTIKRDQNWDYYFNYLLPAMITEDFLLDQKYLYDLVLQGDDLQGLRKVRHWIYFNKLKQRQKMAERLESIKFSIDSINYDRNRNWPYELQVSRMDSITPDNISDLTSLMKILSETYQGQYDGWGTELIQKKSSLPSR